MRAHERSILGPELQPGHARMIDIITVVVPHVLMAIAVWRLLHRDDLDHDPILPGRERGLMGRKGGQAMRGEERPRA